MRIGKVQNGTAFLVPGPIHNLLSGVLGSRNRILNIENWGTATVLTAKMSVNELPTGILEQIFYMHVYLYRQPRKPLLQACRRWHTVASNHGLLWRSITLWRTQVLVPVNVHCSNLRGLAKVINMSGTVTFDFTLGCPHYGEDPTDEDIQLFVNSVDKNWLSRCRSFTLWAPVEQWKIPKTRTVGDLLQRYSYESLETLRLILEGSEMWAHMLGTLMDRVETTSPNLRSLEVVFGSAVEKITENVLQRPSVLRRIQKLDISWFGRSISWGDFENLQQLNICDLEVSYLSDLTNLVAPALTRLYLQGNFLPHDIPSAILPQLTHLTLDGFQIDERESAGKPLSLPSLISLTFLGTRSELASFDAPKLEEFVFQIDQHNGIPYGYPSFEGSTSSPRVIHLDILSDETDEQFNDPLPMWRRVEELHLTTFEDIPFTGTEFMDILCGCGGYSDQMFPTLRHLTLLHPSDCSDGGPSPDEKKVRMDEARDIMEARAAAGLKPFERLRVGWYWTNDNMYVLKDGSREWWVSAWEDCCSGTS